MSSAMVRAVLAVAVLCATAGVSQAQTTSTSTETKSFEVLTVEGHTLVVRLPEGTRELTVADDFRFTVNGQQLAVTQLKPGQVSDFRQGDKLSATIITSKPPTVVTEKEVQATLATAGGGAAAGGAGA